MRMSDWSSDVCSSDLWISARSLRLDKNFAMPGAVNRAFVGDLQQPPTFLRRQVPPHLDDPLDAVDLASLRLTGCDVLDVTLPVRQGDPRPLAREDLARGVEPEAHRVARPEPPPQD